MWGIDTLLDLVLYLKLRTKTKIDKLKCVIHYEYEEDIPQVLRLDIENIFYKDLVKVEEAIQSNRLYNFKIFDIEYLDNYKYLAKFDDDTATFMIDKEQWDSSTTIKVPKMRYKDTYYAN